MFLATEPREGVRGSGPGGPVAMTQARVGRRAFLAVVAGAAVAPPAAAAQRVYRVGIVGSNPSPGWDVLPQRLKELGYVEGQNIVFVYRWSEGDVQRFPRLLAELASLNVDVIVTIAPAARAAKAANPAIPIVMANSGDLVRDGIVASLARPGGHITGLSGVPSRDLQGKQMQLLKDVVPRLSLLGVLFDAASPNRETWQPDLEASARALGIGLRLAPVESAAQLEEVFKGLTKARVGALLVGGQTFEFVNRRRIIELARQHRLPSMYGWRAGAVDGGLMAYGANLADLTRRSGTYVDKILRGANPGDLPIEQASTLELVINLKTASALGLTLPPALLQRADQLIE